MARKLLTLVMVMTIGLSTLGCLVFPVPYHHHHYHHYDHHY